MLAVSYKALPRPQITLYSRTSYLGYLGALDLTVAWMCGRYVAKELNIAVEDISFVWMNEALQYHNFKSLAYLLNHPDEGEQEKYRLMLMGSVKDVNKAGLGTTVSRSPALMLSRRWLQRLLKEDAEGKTLGDMSYNTYRRIRRRFHTEVMGFDYAKQFEGWSVHKRGPQIGEPKEFFKAYAPLPSTPVGTLDLKSIGMPLTGSWGVDYVGGDDDPDDDDD
jgi:hypothetical protein